MSIPETPYTRTEMYLDGIATGDTSGIPEKPYTREEKYWNAIAQGDVTLAPETPYTRKEMYLDAIAQNDGSLAPEFQYTREEMYLDAIAKGEDTAPERPYTRYEMYLDEIAQGGGEQEHTVSGDIVSFTTKRSRPLKALTVAIEPVQAGTGDPSPDNVRPISGWSEVNVWVKPTYDPTANPTATLQLGQTVYGGTLDVTNGVLTVDRAMVDLGTLTWIDYNREDGRYYTTSLASTIKRPASDSTVPDALSSEYPIVTRTAWNTLAVGVSMSGTGNVLVADAAMKGITPSAAKTALSGVQLVYELDTPITIPLTPQEISTLKGTNNLWADTGDVTVTFKGTPSEEA